MKAILWIIIVSLIVICYVLGGKELLYIVGGVFVFMIIASIPTLITEIKDKDKTNI